jgi:D-lactate dehydrogenase
VPTEIGCCGFAGDKGFMIPALNEWGLRKLRPQIVSAGVARGFSNSRTCEMGLTRNSGVPYKSIAYLVDEVTVAAQQNEDSTTRLIQNDDEPTELIFDENK